MNVLGFGLVWFGLAWFGFEDLFILLVRLTEGDRDLLYTDSLPKWPQQPELSQSKTRSHEFVLDLP